MREETLETAVKCLESATASLEACRALLVAILKSLPESEPPIDPGCAHANAVECSTLANGTAFLCPDCDEIFV